MKKKWKKSSDKPLSSPPSKENWTFSSGKWKNQIEKNQFCWALSLEGSSSKERNQLIVLSVMDFIINVFFRNNCEVPCDDFEYFDSRNNNCERIKHIAEKSPVVTPVVDSLHRRYKNKGKNIVILPDHRHQIEDLQNLRLKYSSGSSCRPWWAARPSTRPVTPYWVRDLTAPEWLSMMARGPGLAESWPPASPSFSLITESSGLLLK